MFSQKSGMIESVKTHYKKIGVIMGLFVLIGIPVSHYFRGKNPKDIPAITQTSGTTLSRASPSLAQPLEHPSAPLPSATQPSVQTPIQNAHCLSKAFPGISQNATRLRIEDFADLRTAAPKKISLTIEIVSQNQRHKQLWVAERKSKPRPQKEGSEEGESSNEIESSAYRIESFDLTVEDKPTLLATQGAPDILDVFSHIPQGATIQIDERVFRTNGPEGTTVILRNGQIEHLILPARFKSRCETHPEGKDLENPKTILPLICVCELSKN